MSGTGATELLRNLGQIQSLFPRGFNAVAEVLKAGVSTIELGALGVFSKSPAAYDPEEQTIRLDPGLTDRDRQRLAAEINKRHPGLGVTPEDVFVFIAYHEIGHHVRRRNLLGMPRRNGLLARLSFWEAQDIAEEEMAAEEFAKKKFLEWKRGKSL